jgi:hypothetical protein
VTQRINIALKLREYPQIATTFAPQTPKNQTNITIGDK